MEHSDNPELENQENAENRVESMELDKLRI